MPTLALLNPRVWLEIAILAIVAWLVWFAYHWAYMNGARDVQAQFDAYKLKETQVALQQDVANRAKEQAFQTSLENLTNAYIKKQHELADAKSAADSMLNDFNTTLSSSAAKDSASARSANGSAGLESQLLGNCAEALVRLAEEADGLEARLVALQNYVKETIEK